MPSTLAPQLPAPAIAPQVNPQNKNPMPSPEPPHNPPIARHGAAQLTAENAYSVAVETSLFAFDPLPHRDDVGTSFWMLQGPLGNCSLFPIDVAMFIRIKNLQPMKVMVTELVPPLVET
jgi:hypothetical protein